MTLQEIIGACQEPSLANHIAERFGLPNITDVHRGNKFGVPAESMDFIWVSYRDEAINHDCLHRFDIMRDAPK